MNFNFSHPFKSKIFHNKLNSSSLYSSVTEHASPLISKYKPEQATKIIINTHWSGRRRTYFKSWTYPKAILTTRYIVHPTEYPLVQNETTLLAVPLKATKLKVLHHYIIVKFNVSLLQWVIENFCENHDGSCFTFYPQVLFDQNEENEP